MTEATGETAGRQGFSTLPPLSLYVHLPWCVRKCPYCDFNSHAVADQLPEQAYVDALLGDLENELPGVWGRRIQTVFIGGGTPSLFSPESIDRLLAGIRARIPVSSHAEITLEANPGTVDNARLAEFRAAGINRLSLGIQSFDDELLARLGRIHDSQQAKAAFELARQGGFDNINIDLMFALPGQSRQQAQRDLETALTLQPEHLSYYQLTLEPNTWFHRHPPSLPGDDERWAIQQAGLALLGEHGFERYEVSAFARPGRHCRHNLNYWQFGDYLGIGAGAHGKLTDARHQHIERHWKTRHPRAYLQAPGRSSRVLDHDDIMLEFMMNALRLRDGVSLELFHRHTGLGASQLQAACASAIERGFLELDEQRLRASATGWRFLDSLLETFLPESG